MEKEAGAGREGLRGRKNEVCGELGKIFAFLEKSAKEALGAMLSVRHQHCDFYLNFLIISLNIFICSAHITKSYAFFRFLKLLWLLFLKVQKLQLNFGNQNLFCITVSDQKI